MQRKGRAFILQVLEEIYRTNRTNKTDKNKNARDQVPRAQSKIQNQKSKICYLPSSPSSPTVLKGRDKSCLSLSRSRLNWSDSWRSTIVGVTKISRLLPVVLCDLCLNK